MEKKEKILEFFKDKEYVPMKEKEIAQVLMVPKSERDNLKEILNALEEEYKISKNKKNKYILIENEYKKGKFTKNQKGFGFVKIEGEEEEIFVHQKNTNNALTGDTVLVKLQNYDNKQEAKIIKIIEREVERVVGTFTNSRNFGFVVPDDKKIGTDIFISKKNFKGAKNNQKVVVKINLN